MRPLYICIAAISLIATVITIYDKIAAKHFRRYRIPEAMLFFTAMLGGSVAMYLIMLIIRHKTNHKRFMLGMPLIIIAQVLILWLLPAI